MCARDIYDLSFHLQRKKKFRDLSELLLSPITSRAFPPISSTVLPVPCVKKNTQRRNGPQTV